MIKFLCPGGHELSAGDHLAGKPGKCPKCGVAFLIPDLARAPADSSAGGQAPLADTTSPPPVVAGSSPAPTDAAPPSPASSPVSDRSAAPPADGDMLVFLCPNGHRLSGPRRLQGKAGQCPHCHERFLIPIVDPPLELAAGGGEVAAGESYSTAPPTPGATNASSEGAVLDIHEWVDEPPVASGGVSWEEAAIPEGVSLEASRERAEASPAGRGAPLSAEARRLAELLGDFLRRRQENEIVEVHLDDGSYIVVHRYSPSSSDSPVPLFATQDSDGDYTITAAPWSAVRRLVLRHRGELPDDWFEF